MPRADFTGEFSSNAGRSNFPKLKLQSNERARVCVVTKPNVEYVHWLEAPKIVNMAPKYTKITDREGNEQWVVEKRFVNRAICHGDFATLRERGVDDHGCQACQAARDQPDVFRPPQPRYAATIIRYNMRPGGSWNDIAAPYGVGSLIWSFSGKVFEKLRSITEMGPAYSDLRQVDLCLECSDGNYQKPYSQGEFIPLAPSFWLSNDQVKNYTLQYLQQNCGTDEDLNDSIGRQIKPDWLADDLLRITQAWDVVRAYEARQQGGPALSQGFGTETFQQGMSNLQQQHGQPSQSQQQPPSNGSSPNGGQPNPGRQAPSSVGVDMSLLSGQRQSPFAQAATVELAQNPIQNPVVDAFARSLAQQGTQAAPQQPPTPTPAPPSESFIPPAAPPAPAAEVPVAMAGASPSSPPSGLAGLEEFMSGKTYSEAPAPSPPAVPSGGSFSFDDLKRLAGEP
jgi:hypothetical protein